MKLDDYAAYIKYLDFYYDFIVSRINYFRSAVWKLLSVEIIIISGFILYIANHYDIVWCEWVILLLSIIAFVFSMVYIFCTLCKKITIKLKEPCDLTDYEEVDDSIKAILIAIREKSKELAIINISNSAYFRKSMVFFGIALVLALLFFTFNIIRTKGV